MFQLGLRRPFLARDFSQKPRAGSRINVSMCPISGGALTVAFGWRSVMFVNVPIGIAAALLSQRFLPKTEGWLKNQRLDVPEIGRSADSCFWMAFSNVRQCSNWDCGGPS